MPSRLLPNSPQDPPAGPGGCLPRGRGENWPGVACQMATPLRTLAERQVRLEDLLPAPCWSSMIQLTGKYVDQVRIPGRKEDVIVLGPGALYGVTAPNGGLREALSSVG